MKKLLAVFLCILLSAALFTACDFPMHEHIKGQWEFNASQHWQSVTCTWHTCEINIVSYDHIDNNADGLCDVCSYRPLIITEGMKWYFSDSHHWRTPEGDAVFTPVYGYGEHIDEDTNGICDVCGYKKPIDTEADNVQ